MRSLITFAAAVLVGTAAHGQIASVTAATPAELATALAGVAGPTEIRLAPGPWGDVRLWNVNPPADVVIRPAGQTHATVFRTLSLRNASRLRFDGIRFDRPKTAAETSSANAVMVRESRHIRFTRAFFHGTLNDDPNDDVILLRIHRSQDVLVLDSRFEEGRLGALIESSARVLVASSTFTNMREGVNVGGGERVRLDRNLFTHITPNASEGDHADCMQAYHGLELEGVQGLTITNNLMVPVARATQGILMNNNRSPQTPHRDVHVVNNVYYGGTRNGISLAHVAGARVAGNTLIAAPGFSLAPGVLLRGVQDVRLETTIYPVLYLENAEHTAERNLHTAHRPDVPRPDGAAQLAAPLPPGIPAAAAFAIGQGTQAHALGAGFTPVGEIGGVPDTETESRYAWYMQRFAELTTPGAP